jgi:pilus assembly protein CpaE
MAKTTNKTTVLPVSENLSSIEAIRTALAKEKSLNLVEREITLENLQTVIAETQPDVILLDYEFFQHSSSLIEKIASENPTSAVVVILPESGAVDSDQMALSGVRGFLQHPFQPEDLVTTLQRVMEPREHNATSSISTIAADAIIEHKQTITVFSPKGGAGTTTLATNLAISLQKTLNEDVLLIDGKHLFGHVALYLNLRTGNSITDLISHASMLDEQLIRQVVVRHTSGIYVLPSPNSIIEAQGIRPEDLFKVLQGLQQVFPNIIIDGGNNLNENTVTYMDSSDKILLVLNPDLASMRDIRQFMLVSATLSYPKEKIFLILNLTGRKADVKREEIENILKMKIFGRIPADDNLALSSLNEGVPILLKKPRHPISMAFLEIAKDLANMMQTSKTL